MVPIFVSPLVPLLSKNISLMIHDTNQVNPFVKCRNLNMIMMMIPHRGTLQSKRRLLEFFYFCNIFFFEKQREYVSKRIHVHYSRMLKITMT